MVNVHICNRLYGQHSLNGLTASPSRPGAPVGPAGPWGPCGPRGPGAPPSPPPDALPGGPGGPAGPVGPGSPRSPFCPADTWRDRLSDLWEAQWKETICRSYFTNNFAKSVSRVFSKWLSSYKHEIHDQVKKVSPSCIQMMKTVSTHSVGSGGCSSWLRWWNCKQNDNMSD